MPRECLPPDSWIIGAHSRTHADLGQLADEQAVVRVNAGPVMPSSIEMWLAPALAMARGIVSG